MPTRAAKSGTASASLGPNLLCLAVVRDINIMKNIIEHKDTIVFILSVLLTYGCANGPVSHPDPGNRIESMKNTVRYLAGINPSRSYDHLDSMKKSATYISQKFGEYGLTPQEQEFVVSGTTYVNIVASVGPPGGSRLVVGAHYDVCGNQPGADDNASGIAGLLEIARFAKKHESELPYGVDFVAYALEEPPFFGTNHMGSYVHAESLHNNNVKVKGMICLEMIGFFTDKENSQAYPLSIMRLFYPSKGNFIGVVSNFGSSSLAAQIAEHLGATSLGVRTLKAPSFVTGVDFSDHRNYWKFGYDAVMITDTAFYRNRNYHQETDSMSTLDFAKMHEVIKGICWSILNLK